MSNTPPFIFSDDLSLHLYLFVLQIDVYSFGIVMWELLTGNEPYADMHCASIIGENQVTNKMHKVICLAKM